MSALHVQRGRFRPRSGSHRAAEAGFTCLHCRGNVVADPAFSAVQHRNHCPYCLWSRHLDWLAAGDRLSACKAGMRPIGLAFKLSLRRYGVGRGELMLVHLCVECGHGSINRIAADDDPETILGIFEASLELECDTRARLAGQGVALLGEADRDAVRCQLFGRQGGLETIPGEGLHLCGSTER